MTPASSPPADHRTVASGVDDTRLAGLRRWNLGLAVLHAAQAVAVLVLATDFTITLSTAFPEGPPGTREPAPDPTFDVPVGAAVAAFLALAAVDHLLTGTVLRSRYERDLRAGINRYRWMDYSLRAQPVAAVPTGRAVVQLRVRGEGLPRAQPGREVGAGLADLRRVTGGLRGRRA